MRDENKVQVGLCVRDRESGSQMEEMCWNGDGDRVFIGGRTEMEMKIGSGLDGFVRQDGDGMGFTGDGSSGDRVRWR